MSVPDRRFNNIQHASDVLAESWYWLQVELRDVRRAQLSQTLLTKVANEQNLVREDRGHPVR